MLIALPLKAKNPPPRFPFATITLICLNVLIYLFTSEYFLQIQTSIAKNYAFCGNLLPGLNVITGMFLHGDIFHILGNMLFLWVFGSAVEGRLGVGRFLLVYFASGILGYFLQAGFDLAIFGNIVPCIGASGAVAGLMGAYVYLFSWSPISVFYCVWLFLVYVRIGVADVAATWVILAFVVMNILESLLGVAGFSNGVANLAHLGGLGVGFLFCLALRIKRDSEALSNAKAAHATMKDLSLVPLQDLMVMLDDDPRDSKVLRAIFEPAIRLQKENVIHSAMERAGASLADIDPSLVSYYLTKYPGSKAEIYPPVALLKVAGAAERANEAESAVQMYKIIADKFPSTPDAEMALYRSAACYWNSFKNAENAKACLRELAAKHPNGPMTPFGKTLWNQIAQVQKTSGSAN